MHLIALGLQIGGFGQFAPSTQITNLLKMFDHSQFVCATRSVTKLLLGDVGDHVWSILVYYRIQFILCICT